MTVICFGSRKGGTAKTTTARTMGAYLADLGYKVLCVDTDSQLNLTMLSDAAPDAKTIYDVFFNKEPVDNSIQPLRKYDLLSSDPRIALADAMLTQTGKEYRLKETLEKLKPKYDYILIDTAPALGVMTTNALTAADELIIPIQADIVSLQGIHQLMETVTAVKRYCNRDLKVEGILLTRYSQRSVISRDMRKQAERLAETYGTKVFNTEIRECTALKEADALRQDIYEYSKRSNGAKDYKAFVEEYLHK